MVDKEIYDKYVRPNLKKNEVTKYRELLNTPLRKLNSKCLEYIKKHGVYITLTSSPLRLKKIGVTLSIILTNPYIRKIYVTLPRLYRNKEPYSDKDIKFIEDMSSRIEFRRPADDIGPITKVLPTLKAVRDPNSIIISIDDDIGYPVCLINELIHFSVTYPNIIWTGSGFVWEEFEGTMDFNRKKWPKRKPRWPTVDIVEGWGAISYKKRLVDIPFLEKLAKLDINCKLSDDLTISYMFADKGIVMKNINSKYYEDDGYLFPFKYGLQGDALHQGSGLGEYVENANIVKYVKCLDNIDDFVKNKLKRSPAKRKVSRKKTPAKRKVSRKKTPVKKCTSDKILNPKTNRCVLKSGKIGKSLL